MSTHSICFHGEIRKLFLYPLIYSFSVMGFSLYCKEALVIMHNTTNLHIKGVIQLHTKCETFRNCKSLNILAVIYSPAYRYFYCISWGNLRRTYEIVNVMAHIRRKNEYLDL